MPTAEFLCGISTCSPNVLQLLDRIRRFSALHSPILIQGETGTGKELVARALHTLGPRASKALVVVDCGSLPESIIESELFGHERGSFTGADRRYVGRIEAASGGTLFLDEINSTSLSVQSKLLRFVENGELCRIGQASPVHVDVRLVSASNMPLERLVREGRMRADFFYRLNVLPLDVPPLRERLDDLSMLAQQFLAADPLAQRCDITTVTAEVLAELRAHVWPGNVRELRNALSRAVALATHGGALGTLDRRTEPAASAPDPDGGGGQPEPAFRAWMRDRERDYLAELVRRHRTTSDQATAAALPLRTLYRKLRSHQLSTVGAFDDADFGPSQPWREPDAGRQDRNG